MANNAGRPEYPHNAMMTLLLRGPQGPVEAVTDYMDSINLLCTQLEERIAELEKLIEHNWDESQLSKAERRIVTLESENDRIAAIEAENARLRELLMRTRETLTVGLYADTVRDTVEAIDASVLTASSIGTRADGSEGLPNDETP